MADFSPNVVKNFVYRFLASQADPMAVKLKAIREYLESKLQCPEGTFKAGSPRQMLEVYATQFYSNASKEVSTTPEPIVDTLIPSNSPLPKKKDVPENHNSDWEVKRAETVKKGKFSDYEKNIIISTLENFVKEEEIEIQSICPYFRSGELDPKILKPLWDKLDSYLPSRPRTSKQAFVYRYIFGLEYNGTKFTDDEKFTLLSLVEQYGNDMKIISKLMHKSPDRCRQMMLLLERMKTGPFTVEEDRVLIDAVNKATNNPEPSILPRANIPWREVSKLIIEKRAPIDYTRRWPTILKLNEQYGYPNASMNNFAAAKKCFLTEQEESVVKVRMPRKFCDVDHNRYEMLKLLKEMEADDFTSVTWIDIDRKLKWSKDSAARNFKILEQKYLMDVGIEGTFQEIVDFFLEIFQSSAGHGNENGIDSNAEKTPSAPVKSTATVIPKISSTVVQPTNPSNSKVVIKSTFATAQSSTIPPGREIICIDLDDDEIEEEEEEEQPKTAKMNKPSSNKLASKSVMDDDDDELDNIDDDSVDDPFLDQFEEHQFPESIEASVQSLPFRHLLAPVPSTSSSKQQQPPFEKSKNPVISNTSPAAKQNHPNELQNKHINQTPNQQNKENLSKNQKKKLKQQLRQQQAQQQPPPQQPQAPVQVQQRMQKKQPLQGPQGGNAQGRHLPSTSSSSSSSHDSPRLPVPPVTISSPSKFIIRSPIIARSSLPITPVQQIQLPTNSSGNLLSNLLAAAAVSSSSKVSSSSIGDISDSTSVTNKKEKQKKQKKVVPQSASHPTSTSTLTSTIIAEKSPEMPPSPHGRERHNKRSHEEIASTDDNATTTNTTTDQPSKKMKKKKKEKKHHTDKDMIQEESSNANDPLQVEDETITTGKRSAPTTTAESDDMIIDEMELSHKEKKKKKKKEKKNKKDKHDPVEQQYEVEEVVVAVAAEAEKDDIHQSVVEDPSEEEKKQKKTKKQKKDKKHKTGAEEDVVFVGKPIIDPNQVIDLSFDDEHEDGNNNHDQLSQEAITKIKKEKSKKHGKSTATTTTTITNSLLDDSTTQIQIISTMHNQPLLQRIKGEQAASPSLLLGYAAISGDRIVDNPMIMPSSPPSRPQRSLNLQQQIAALPVAPPRISTGAVSHARGIS